jgi:metallophosphoesterase (TIGR03767 family)
MAASVAVLAMGAAACFGHPPAARSGQPPKARPAQADTQGESTLRRTLIGGDPAQGFSFLRPGPGEAHVVRQELAPAQAGRERRRRSLVYLAQLTDFQLSDEESPARVEFFDADPSGTTSSAWRPQEALVAHQVEYTIRQVNRFLQSPVGQAGGRRARLLNAVLTGDLADNAQRNETEWVVRLLEGGTLDPASGTTDLAGSVCPSGAVIADFDDPRRYTGVQDYDDYAVPGNIFYDPEDPRGVYAQRGWPVYPYLLDRAQQPFQAEGLRVPSYVAFGNHDALAQGNEDPIAPYEEVATGCIKPIAPVSDNPSDALGPGILERFLADPSKFMLVPPDSRRQYVDKRQFKQLHATGHQSDAHGFALVDREEAEASLGSASYYSFEPRRDIRYVVIDTVSEGGVTPQSSEGNVDDPQFRWLEAELRAAQRRDELILVFGHHATGSLEAEVPDEIAPPCTTNDEHDHDVNPGCDRDPRPSTPLHLGDDLAALFRRFPNVIAYVAGHSHENRVAAIEGEGGRGFWEIKSPAVVDWPPQHRLVEVMDNRDGTLSIFGTLLDHASPSTSPPAGDAAGFTPEQLASVGRTLTYNDPQVGPASGSQGERRDRNVELLIRDPRASASDRDEDRRRASRRGRDGDRGGGSAGAGDEGDAGTAAAGDLPFTGYGLLAPLLLGLLLTAVGALARLGSRR